MNATMRFTLVARLLISASAVLGAPPAPPAPPYTALYFFSDSWSATNDGLYWRSRWSNGPMWLETLSTNWGLTYLVSNNYAKGGATTSDVISSQAPRFIGASNAATSLFVVWVGGNDVYDYLVANGTLNSRALTNGAGWSNLFVRMSRNLSNSIVQLHRKGARTVMIPDVDEVHRWPLFPELSEAQAAQVSEWVAAFNSLLKATVTALNASVPDLRVLPLDFHDRWNEFLDQAVSLGFTRTDVGALQDPGLKDKTYSGPGRDYVFWDGVHPTTRVHSLWADWFAEVATGSRTESLRLVTRSNAFDVKMIKLKPGRSYTLEFTQNLRDWAAHASFTAAEGTNTVTMAASPDDPIMEVFRLAWTE